MSDVVHHGLAILPDGLKGYVSNEEVQHPVNKYFELLCPTYLLSADPFVVGITVTARPPLLQAVLGTMKMVGIADYA